MPQFVRSAGIDCGKRFLDVAVHGGETIRLRNEPVDHQRLVVWLTERGVTRIGLEASGGYERAVRDVLCAAGLEVHILDPARVRHFAKAKGRRAKTDPIDARVIAEFTATLVDTPPVTVEPAREELAKLIRTRRLLVAKRADMAKAVKDLPDAARTVVETALASLGAAIAALEQADRSADRSRWGAGQAGRGAVQRPRHRSDHCGGRGGPAARAGTDHRPRERRLARGRALCR